MACNKYPIALILLLILGFSNSIISKNPKIKKNQILKYYFSKDKKSFLEMIDDFKKRFFVSLVITLPIIVLSPMIQHWLGFTEALSFSGDLYLLFGLSTFVYFYGFYIMITCYGWNFTFSNFINNCIWPNIVSY